MAEAEIIITKGKHRGALVRIDEEDADLVSGYTWCISQCDDKLYVQALIYLSSGRRRTVKMHRLIAGAMPGVDVDHWDRNGLNNTRANLRVATRSQNNANARKRRGVYSSQYKGVRYHKAARKWMAEIQFEGERFYLGLHPTEEGAAHVYDDKAAELFGEFARPNFPRIASHHAIG